MKTKKIVADTMPLALKKVRQELGDNAIIVNTKAIKTGGVFGLFAKQKFEVTAYSDQKESALSNQIDSFEAKEKIMKRMVEIKKHQELQTEDEKRDSIFHKSPQKLYSYYSQSSSGMNSEKTTAAPLREQTVNIAAQISPNKIEAKASHHDADLLKELQDMRKMMMSFMMNSQQGEGLPANVSFYVERLKANGVDSETMEHILANLMKKHESLHDLDQAHVRSELYEIIKEMIAKCIPESKKIHDSTRMVNVIGPTGVGKTTSIAKLATEQVLKQKRKVAMITTDVYRIAAVEQLKTYAGILNVPIEVVRSAEEMDYALQKLKNFDLIYMDTTGRNYKEVKHRESIQEFLNHPLKSDNYLVLSLTTKYEDMKILLNEFNHSPVQKLIFTKFDETSSYGSILNIAHKYTYQFVYVTNGQSVPEDIIEFDADMIARHLVGEEM